MPQQTQTHISYAGSTIKTTILGPYSDHFREWACLWIAVRYLEDSVIPNLYYVTRIYEEVTGRNPIHYNLNGIEM